VGQLICARLGKDEDDAINKGFHGGNERCMAICAYHADPKTTGFELAGSKTLWAAQMTILQ
jgi:hypothetical protein